MSSCLIFVLSVFRRDWQRLAVSCMVFLAALLVGATALAQNQGSGFCFETVDSHVVMDGQSYTVITVNGHEAEANPMTCNLYAASWLYPIVDPVTKKNLRLYEYGRAVYAANQGWLGKVIRRCVETTDRKPPQDATDEEKALCPHARVNYIAIPSNGWKAKIRIPSAPTLTWGERQQAAARVACSEATSPAARQTCKEAGQDVGHQPSSTGSTPSSSAPAAGDQSVPPANDAGAVSEQLDARIRQLEAENADLRTKLAKAGQKEPESVQSVAKAGQDASLPWAIVILLSLSLLAMLYLEERRVKQAKAASSRDDKTIPPHVATLRAQLQEADAKVKGLETELADSKKESEQQLALKDAEIAQIREQHKTDLDTKKQEDLRIREELKRVRQNSVDKSVYNQSESDNAELRKQNAEQNKEKAQYKERAEKAEARAAAQDAEVARLAGELASQSASPESQSTEPADASECDKAAEILALKREINGYHAQVMELEGQGAQKDAQIQSLQDRLGQALAGEPPTTMPFPPTAETPSTPSAETPSTHEIQTGQTADIDPFSLLTLAEKAVIQAIVDAYRQYMPDLVQLLGGELVMLEGVGPQIVWSRTLRMAEKQREALQQAENMGLHAAAGQGGDHTPLPAPPVSPSIPLLAAYVDGRLNEPPVQDVELDQETRVSWHGNESGPEAPTVPRGRRVIEGFLDLGAEPSFDPLAKPAPQPIEPTVQPAEKPSLPEGRSSFSKTLAPSPRMLAPEPDEPDKGGGS